MYSLLGHSGDAPVEANPACATLAKVSLVFLLAGIYYLLCMFSVLLYVQQEHTSSFSYDYVPVAEPNKPMHMKSIAESNYEVDPNNEEPYWEPSSREDELKMQIKKLGVLEITLESLK